MGWFEWLSGSNAPEGARNPSVAEKIEYNRYVAHHSPPKADEALVWEGSLFTGYHYHKVKRGEVTSTEYIKWTKS
jgi:hypothetical protein